MKRLLLLSAALVAALGTRGALGQDLVQGQFGPGGTWNLYRFVTDVPSTWVLANEDASSQSEMGVTGHLADVLSLDENLWLNANSGRQNVWIGLTDREGVAPAATSGGLPAPQESQELADRLTQGWAWTSGQPFVYNNWASGEPNNWDPVAGAAGAATLGEEDVVELAAAGTWNDHSGGFFENEPVAPTIQPNTSLDETGNAQNRAYVIEFPIQSPTMFPGIPAPGVPSLLVLDLPGIPGEPGLVGVTNYYDLGGQIGSLAAANDYISQIKDGDLEPGETAAELLAITDFADLNTSANGGPVIATAPLPFPGTDPAIAYDDFLSVAKGTIEVPKDGTYTIQVRADDGFGLRVIDKPFSAAYGPNANAQLDTDGSLLYVANTGDTNTRGVIELTAGTHEFEALFYERGGGAFWEMTMSDGANPVVDLNRQAWRPLVGPADPLTPPTANLPGVATGMAGSVGVTDYYGLGGQVTTLANAADLLQQIQSGDLEPDLIATGQYDRINIADPDAPGGGGNAGPILDDPAAAFPSDTPGLDDDDFISVVKGAVEVTEPGTYTIQVRSDDGFGMRFLNTPFSGVYGGGQLDYDRSMIFNAATGDSDTRGVIELSAGTHEFEMVYFERAGGAYMEVTSAQGEHPYGNSAQWLALGDASEVPGYTDSPGVFVNGPMFVGNLNAVGASDAAGTLEILYDDLMIAVEDGTLAAEASDLTQLILDDHDLAQACPFGDNPGFRDPATVAQFPNQTGAAMDDFSTIVMGSLSIDDGDDVQGETLMVTFHIDADDMGLLHIPDMDFEQATIRNGTEALYPIGEDGALALYGDGSNCNINISGLIELTEGESYDFEVAHGEIGGNAGIQVLAAIGDYVNNPFDATKFVALAEFELLQFPRNLGLAFVEPRDGLLGDYNNNGELDVADLDLQAIEIAGGQDPADFDLTGDGLVNEDDRVFWLHDLKGTWVGDADLDGLFDSLDFVAVFVEGLYETGEAAGWAQGDWNADLVFDSGDFVAAFVDGGYEAGALPGAVQAVPEPSSLVLALLSLAGLVGLARRRG